MTRRDLLKAGGLAIAGFGLDACASGPAARRRQARGGGSQPQAQSLRRDRPASSLITPDQRTPASDAQFRQAADIAYRQLQLLVGAGYGVYWQDSYSATDDPTRQGGGGSNEGTGDLLPEALRTGDDREVL